MADEKKPTKPRKVRPVYVVMSIDDGQGGFIDGSKLTVHEAHKDSDALLEALDAGGLGDGRFYKRIAL